MPLCPKCNQASVRHESGWLRCINNGCRHLCLRLFQATIGGKILGDVEARLIYRMGHV